MAFIMRVGAANLPQPGDEVAVYLTGTSTLVTGLKTPDTAALPLSNPFTVPASGQYGFEVPDASRVDVYWLDESQYVVTDVNVFDVTPTLKSGATSEATRPAAVLVTPEIFAAKGFTFADEGLPNPASLEKTLIRYHGALLQIGVDVGVTVGSGAVLNWNILGLDGQIEAGEYLELVYAF